MNALIIACETLRDEIELIIRDRQITLPVLWLSNALHASPDALRAALQEAILAHQDYSHLLLAFGGCGGGLVGLTSPRSTLVIPRFEDCIAMLLCRYPDFHQRYANTFFLTKGWLSAESPILTDLTYQLERYGPQRSRRIMQILYQHYQYLMMIDTGAYTMASIQPVLDTFLDLTGLTPVCEKGDLTILIDLLTGRWDDNFILVSPGKTTENADFDPRQLPLVPCTVNRL